jgi:hypothetical protein
MSEGTPRIVLWMAETVIVNHLVFLQGCQSSHHYESEILHLERPQFAVSQEIQVILSNSCSVI